MGPETPTGTTELSQPSLVPLALRLYKTQVTGPEMGTGVPKLVQCFTSSGGTETSIERRRPAQFPLFTPGPVYTFSPASFDTLQASDGPGTATGTPKLDPFPPVPGTLKSV